MASGNLDGTTRHKRRVARGSSRPRGRAAGGSDGAAGRGVGAAGGGGGAADGGGAGQRTGAVAGEARSRVASGSRTMGGSGGAEGGSSGRQSGGVRTTSGSVGQEAGRGCRDRSRNVRTASRNIGTVRGNVGKAGGGDAGMQAAHNRCEEAKSYEARFEDRASGGGARRKAPNGRCTAKGGAWRECRAEQAGSKCQVAEPCIHNTNKQLIPSIYPAPHPNDEHDVHSTPARPFQALGWQCRPSQYKMRFWVGGAGRDPAAGGTATRLMCRANDAAVWRAAILGRSQQPVTEIFYKKSPVSTGQMCIVVYSSVAADATRRIALLPHHSTLPCDKVRCPTHWLRGLRRVLSGYHAARERVELPRRVFGTARDLQIVCLRRVEVGGREEGDATLHREQDGSEIWWTNSGTA
ncbi:hypothetical protein B0H11DRAFT_1908052 [Mycena galericulata]|nr:hypothetical protein B0H11DRAFT_1908052 [Mycena galericulata]